MSSMYDTPLYQDFVSPAICKELFILGLTAEVPYEYKVIGKSAVLSTYAFDHDDYYIQSDANLREINKLNRVFENSFPAYTIKDMEKALPGDIILQRTERGYEIMCENIYQIPSVQAERLPDCFAMAVRAWIRSKPLTIANCNRLISQLQNLPS